MSLRQFYLAGIVAIVGCASGAAGTAGGTPHSGDVITSQEVANFTVEGRSAYDIVSRLRPRWVAAHSSSYAARVDSTEYALVFVDGRAAGRPNSLRDIPAEQVADMRYYDVAEAQGKYGARGASGVIEVRLRRSPNQ
jgi:hypothetical protein